MDIKSLIDLKYNSGLMRKALSWKYKDNHFYKLPFGRIRGLKLYYQKDINFHAMLGFWEMGSLNLLIRLFNHFGLRRKPSVVIADVGGNIGYYSLFFSRQLDPTSKIFCFEPSSSILPVLKMNLAENHVQNVQVLELACDDHVGKNEFFIGAHHHQSSLIPEWSDNDRTGTKTEVATVTLDYFFEKFNQGGYPDLIKMDIEGGAVRALKGCDQCIRQKRPFILIESHTPGEDQAISELLLQYDYEAFRVNNRKWVKHKKENYKDRDGIWGTMLLMPAEKQKGFIN